MPQPSLSPRVSVVMCTYKGTAYLQTQLETMLTQHLLPNELIVADDNSGDGTVAILENFRQRAPFPVRITINPRNLGSTRNFEAAMQQATGEFIALCDQDDLWYPDKLFSLAAVLQSDPAIGGVFSDAQLVRGPQAVGSGKTLWQQHGFLAPQQKQFCCGGAFDLLLRHDVITGATFMVRASLQPLWLPIPPSWVHDGWIAWMLAVHSRLSLVERPLMEYRIHEQQQLGVGHSTYEERIHQIRRTERDRYLRVANQFDDLRQRLLQQEVSNAALLQDLDRKISFLRRRAELPHGIAPRLPLMLKDIPNYRRYARGWRSFRKDLLLN